MNLVLLLERELKVNDKADLLDINATSEEIRADKYTDIARAEVLHTLAALSDLHIAVDALQCKLRLLHLHCKPFCTLALVAVNNSLADLEL